MSNHIVIEREQLERLRLALLHLRDFIQDLDNIMLLLLIPIDAHHQFNRLDFIEFLISIATDKFPPEHCREFEEAVENAQNLLREILHSSGQQP